MNKSNYIKKATALKYTKQTDNAPKVIAKGANETARNIIKIAKQHNIPIKKDEDLVQMLSMLEVDEEIPTSLYEAVADIFKFIYGISNETKLK